jgi:hypothetical protein
MSTEKFINTVKKFLDLQNWINAKSYEASYPHFYINKNNSTDPDFFVHVIEYIRQFGIAKSFYSKQYIYLEIDGYEYWDMGRPSLTTIILNKAKINDNAKYRSPKPTLEQHITLRDKLIKRDIYLNTLLNKDFKSESDIKQIKFLLDTKRRIEGGGKNIIDNYNQKVIYE